MELVRIGAKCINRGDVEYFRYICRTANGKYVWIDGGTDDRPGFAVWYNDPVIAERDLDIDDGKFAGEDVWDTELILCTNGDVTVLKSDLVDWRIYVFRGLHKAVKARGVELFNTVELWRYLAQRDPGLLKLIMTCSKNNE